MARKVVHHVSPLGSFKGGEAMILNDNSGTKNWTNTKGLTKNFGDIFCHDSSTAQSIPTGDTYTQSDCLDTEGHFSICTPDIINNQMIINKAGFYSVNASVSFKSGTANVEWLGAAFLDEVEQDQIHFKRKTGPSGDIGAAGFSGIVHVESIPATLSLRFRHNNNGSVNLTVAYANLSCHFVG